MGYDPSGFAAMAIYKDIYGSLSSPLAPGVGGGRSVAGLVVCAAVTYLITTSPAVTDSKPIALPFPNAAQRARERALAFSQAKAEEREKVATDPPERNFPTYYHATTLENALLIQSSGVMKGSPWEGGYIFAWQSMPSQQALEASGAHFGVVISFKTDAAFSKDPYLTDGKFRKFGPVRSVWPVPIHVKDVQIVRIK